MKFTISLILIIFSGLFFPVFSPELMALDHQHGDFNALLKKNIIWINNGTASRVDYHNFQKDIKLLNIYTGSLSSVTRREFEQWTRSKQLSFLINTYNAFTIELILSKYPDLKSIKELGSIFKSPWKKRFFILFGEKHSLDEVEHEIIRKEGVYDEPLIHFAVVCAAIGCPGLRNEAYTHDKLESQLLDGAKRFLSDRSRNRFNSETGTLELSKIFRWYKGDFASGKGKYSSLKGFLGQFASQLSARSEEQTRIRTGKFDVDYLDYDWALNDINMKISR